MKGSFFGPGGSLLFSAEGFLNSVSNEKVKRSVRNPNTTNEIMAFGIAALPETLDYIDI